jgi:hypothetical protein
MSITAERGEYHDVLAEMLDLCGEVPAAVFAEEMKWLVWSWLAVRRGLDELDVLAGRVPPESPAGRIYRVVVNRQEAGVSDQMLERVEFGSVPRAGAGRGSGETKVEQRDGFVIVEGSDPPPPKRRSVRTVGPSCADLIAMKVGTFARVDLNAIKLKPSTISQRVKAANDWARDEKADRHFEGYVAAGGQYIVKCKPGPPAPLRSRG